VLGAIAASLSAGSVAAVELTATRVGLDGHYKIGFWTPVTLEFADADSFTGELEIIAPDGDGAPVSYISPLEFKDNSVVRRCVRFGRSRGDLTVIVREGGVEILRSEFEAGVKENESFQVGLPVASELMLELGSDVGVGAVQAKRRRKANEDVPAVTAQVFAATDLPDVWYGYEGVDGVVLTTGENDLLESMSLLQRTALTQWVRLGGKLVFSVGSKAETIFATTDQPNPIARLSPGEFKEVSELRRAVGLESLIKSDRRIDVIAHETSREMLVAVIDNVAGDVIASEGGQEQRIAIISKRGFDFGEITTVAFDLDADPIMSWPGREDLLFLLLYGDSTRSKTRDGGQERSVVHLGYDDLSGQLRAALDQFSTIRLAHFSWIAAIIVIYILLIGPADYFLLKKLRKLKATWITFPFLVVAFSALAIGLAFWWQGRDTKVNQVDLVDISLTEEGPALIRGTTWTNIYSPQANSYSVSAATTDLIKTDLDGSAGSEMLLAWQGLPGSGLGGMDAVGAFSASNEGYRLDEPAFNSETKGSGSLAGLPITSASSRTIIGRWQAEADLPRKSRLRQRKASGSVQGVVANPLQVELQDAVLFYGGWVYTIKRPLAPGAAVELTSGANQRSVDWRLNEKTIDMENKDHSTPWDPANFDVPRIMDVMMFNKKAGGRGYTDLHNRYHDFVDLSDQLALNRAVLLARVQQPATNLIANDEQLDEEYEQRWTFIRVVLPVAKE